MDESATLAVIGHDLCDAVEYVLGSEQDREDIVDYACFYAKIRSVLDMCKQSLVMLVTANNISAIMTTIAIKKVIAPRHPAAIEYLRDERLIVASKEMVAEAMTADSKYKRYTLVEDSAIKPRLFGFVDNKDPFLLMDLVHLAAQNRAMVFSFLLDFIGSHTNPTEASVTDAIGLYASPKEALAAYTAMMREDHRDEFAIWNARRKISLILFDKYNETAPLRDFFLMTQCMVAPWKSLVFRFIPCMTCLERDACRGIVRWVATHCKYCAYNMGLPPSIYCVYGCDEHFETREAFDDHVHARCPIKNPFRCQFKDCFLRFPTRSLLVKHIHEHKVYTLQF